MNYLISVIIPVYNVEAYLTKCINSVLTQTYKNYEILLIDDGSTDKSGLICENYANKYKNIYAFHKNNSGLGLTRNYGLNRAKGEYVTFIDSDDYVNKDYLKKLITPIFHDHNVDTVVGGFVQVNNSDNKLYKEEYNYQVYTNKNVKEKMFPRMLGSLPGVRDSIKPMVWNCLYSRKLITKFSLKFVSERRLISEDVVWDSDYFGVAGNVVIINSTDYYYRFNPESLSQKYDTSRFLRIINFYKYMNAKLQEMNLDDEAQVRLKKGLFVALSACISQTKGLSILNSSKEIKYMCRDNLINSSIKKYPIKKLNYKQRFFLYLVKKKYSLMLALLSKLNLVHS